MYPYGLIGNCQSSALVRENGSMDWLCFPRPDSPPVFGRLLDSEGGHFSVELERCLSCRQEYVPGTNVLVTILQGPGKTGVKITDFCPRYQQYGRMYRPMSVFRRVEPLESGAVVRVSCRPVLGWGKEPAPAVRGNSHLRFDIRGQTLRLNTDMPLTYLWDESYFALKEPVHFALTWDSALTDELPRLFQASLEQTIAYWTGWVKHCSIPTFYQQETIRSALALKLHCYEDTGAILAALTTSLPEEPGGDRNWDYRFCWLRDAYFTLTAFHNLGHFEEMEGFIKFLLDIAENHDQSRSRLHPVYRLDRTLPLPEEGCPAWAGYAGSRPVRHGNQAADHVQNDVYGEMVLTLSPIFFDERFQGLRTREHAKLITHLGRLCAAHVSKPDAGLWELRDGWQEHSFSNLMCWAGLDRLERLSHKGLLADLDFDVPKARAEAEAAVRAAVRDGILGNGPQDPTVDSALLLLSMLRFPDAELGMATLARIREELCFGSDDVPSSFLYRYIREDDFGRPKSAFLICSFWLVQALARTGHLEEARRVLKNVMEAATPLGLFSEHFLPLGKKQSGNFPQAYSHVGQINAAFAVSPPWSEIL